MRLLIVVSGQMELMAGPRRVSAGMGSGLFIEGDASYSYVTRGEILYISADFCADGPAFLDLLPEPWVPLAAPSLIAAASAFVAHAFSPVDAAQAAVASIRGQRAKVFAHAFSPVDAPQAAVASIYSQRAKVLAHIAAHHVDTEMSVATLAADLGLSTRSLQRLFAGQEKGVAEEIAAVRLHHALTLLENPTLAHLRLEEIARRSGFGTVPRMRRTIQVATGKSLREHRERHAGAEEREPPIAV